MERRRQLCVGIAAAGEVRNGIVLMTDGNEDGETELGTDTCEGNNADDWIRGVFDCFFFFFLFPGAVGSKGGSGA